MITCMMSSDVTVVIWECHYVCLYMLSVCAAVAECACCTSDPTLRL